MASINYSGLKKTELTEIARRKKAPVTASMNKDELIKAIKKAVKSKAAVKAKPVSKSKAKARPVKKTGTKAKPSKKAKAAKTAPVKKAKVKAKAKAKTKAKTKVVAKAKAKNKTKAIAKVKAKAKVKTKAIAKVKAKTKTEIIAKVKAKTKKISGSTAKKKKSVVSKSARPSTPAKKKAVSAKKAINKPVKKAARPAVVKEPPPKPVSKKRSVSAKKTSIGKPAVRVAPLAVIKEQAPKPISKKKDRSDWDIPIDAEKFFTADEQGDFSPEEETRLPDSYGEDRLVALPKDPGSLFVYWEVLEVSSEKARRSLDKSWKQVKWTLRVYDVTGLPGVEEASHNFFDVTVDPEAGKRYLDVEGDGREYIVELGLIDDDNRFSLICFSNRVQTPRAGLSAGDDDLLTEEAQKLYALSGGGRPGSAFIEETASMGVSSFGASEQSPAIREKHDFSMWVNCEVTVYGGIAPGSRLVLQGQEVSLRPDGAFSAKFHLPDGVQDIQVCGTSSDGADSKQISLSVSRSSRIVR